jgi:hypothetical protein
MDNFQTHAYFDAIEEMISCTMLEKIQNNFILPVEALMVTKL